MTEENYFVTPSFEAVIWKLELKPDKIHILALYRTPSWSIVRTFTLELIYAWEDIISSYTNLITFRDFNIHIDDSHKVSVQDFVNTMNAIGMEIHT